MVSCTGKNPVQEITNTSIEHASLLKIENIEKGLTFCRIANPWKPEETIIQYLITDSKDLNPDKKAEIESTFGAYTLINTPLQHITLTASCHAYLLSQIDAIDNVAAMSDADYAAYAPVKEMIEKEKIADAGSSMSPNIETILSVNSDAVWISPFENSNAGNLEKLPIPIICCADYMETSPLGRAEWMKFYGLLVGKEQLADSLFSLVETNYAAKTVSVETTKDNITDSIPSISPTLLAEIPYQATWYVPGGSSTMGILYKDSGFDYPWADDNHSGSLNLSTEIVFNKAHDADIWIFKYLGENDLEMENFLAINHFFPQFKAAISGNVYGCNTSTSDYYDVIPFRPDFLIEELAKIKEGKDGQYFKKLKR